MPRSKAVILQRKPHLECLGMKKAAKNEPLNHLLLHRAMFDKPGLVKYLGLYEKYLGLYDSYGASWDLRAQNLTLFEWEWTVMYFSPI